MGLLGLNDEDAMALSMGLLSAGGSQSNFGAGIAQAYGGMQQQRQARQQTEMRQQEMQSRAQAMEMQKMQMIQAQKQQADQEAAKVGLQNYVAQMPDGPQKQQIVQAVRMGVPMKDVWDKLNPKQEPYTLSPGAQRFGPDNQPLASVPTKPDSLPWYVQKGPNGTQIDPAYADFEKAKASAGRAPTPYFQFLPTANGYAVGDARSGNISPATIGGNSVLRAADDPRLQGQIAQSKETGKTIGETVTKAQFDLPQAIAQGQQTIKLVDDLLKAPGLNTATGLSSKIDPRNYIPGTDAKDFGIRLDQLKGQQFLQAYETLKGSGQITEVEGKKATDAISRMNQASSTPEFIKASKEFQSVIRLGTNRAKMRAGNVTLPDVTPMQQEASPLDSLLQKYGGQ